MIELLQDDESLFAYLSASIKLDLEARLVYVS